MQARDFSSTMMVAATLSSRPPATIILCQLNFYLPTSCRRPRSLWPPCLTSWLKVLLYSVEMGYTTQHMAAVVAHAGLEVARSSTGPHHLMVLGLVSTQTPTSTASALRRKCAANITGTPTNWCGTRSGGARHSFPWRTEKRRFCSWVVVGCLGRTTPLPALACALKVRNVMRHSTCCAATTTCGCHCSSRPTGTCSGCRSCRNLCCSFREQNETKMRFEGISQILWRPFHQCHIPRPLKPKVTARGKGVKPVQKIEVV